MKHILGTSGYAAGLLAAAVGLGGCAAPAPAEEQADSTYCYRFKSGRPPFDKARYRTCTTDAVPSAQADAAAKRFEAVAGLATVYVVRRGPGDVDHRIPVTVDGSTQAETVPRSLVRIRLQPGSHTLAFQQDGVQFTQPLRLRAGEVRFVGLQATGWLGSTQYGWAPLDTSFGKDLALQTRLVADLHLPGSSGGNP